MRVEDFPISDRCSSDRRERSRQLYCWCADFVQQMASSREPEFQGRPLEPCAGRPWQRPTFGYLRTIHLKHSSQSTFTPFRVRNIACEDSRISVVSCIRGIFAELILHQIKMTPCFDLPELWTWANHEESHLQAPHPRRFRDPLCSSRTHC